MILTSLLAPPDLSLSNTSKDISCSVKSSNNAPQQAGLIVQSQLVTSPHPVSLNTATTDSNDAPQQAGSVVQAPLVTPPTPVSLNTAKTDMLISPAITAPSIKQDMSIPVLTPPVLPPQSPSTGDPVGVQDSKSINVHKKIYVSNGGHIQNMPALSETPVTIAVVEDIEKFKS